MELTKLIIIINQVYCPYPALQAMTGMEFLVPETRPAQPPYCRTR
jgi:hypothetical protein